MKKKIKAKAAKRVVTKTRPFSISGVASDGDDTRGIPPIKRLWVSGWKSIANLTSLDLGKLTVLAGANSSGKSSFFQPTLMLKQTLEAPYDPGALMLDGPHVRFTEASQFLSVDGRTGKYGELVVGVETEKDLIEATYTKPSNRPIEVVRERTGLGADEMIITANMSANEVKALLGRNAQDIFTLLGTDVTKTDLSVTRNRCFLSLQITMDRGPGHKISFFVGGGENGDVIRAIRSIIHLPGLRGNPERTYPLNATEGLYPGQFQGYTASLIQRWKDSPKKDKLHELNRALTDLGLTSEITTATVDEIRVEIKVGRLLESDCKEFVSIADVGLAVSQVLPLGRFSCGTGRTACVCRTTRATPTSTRSGKACHDYGWRHQERRSHSARNT